MAFGPRNRALDDRGGGVASRTTDRDTSTQSADTRSQEETQAMNGHSEPENETADKNSADASSSSEAEDLALQEELEELARKKARIEAKLQARRLRKAEKAGNEDSSQEQSGKAAAPNIDSEGEAGIAVKKSAGIEVLSDRNPGLSSLVIDFTDGPTERSPSEMVTPTRRTAAFISPGLRTPSPPSRTRHLMSPPSGATSRKRQHSPSPLPKKSSSSTQRARLASLTPSSRRRLFVTAEVAAELRGGSPIHKSLATEGESTSTIADDPFQDLPDDDLHDSLWDVEFERLSPEPTTKEESIRPSVMGGNGRSNIKESASHSLASMATSGGKTGSRSVTEVLEAQRQRREAEVERQKAPRATFHTIAASGRPLTATESTRLAPDFDPTTGFRIRDRVTSCEDVAKMTRDLRIIPIKDGDRIRENEVQRSSSGILPSSTSGRLAIVGGGGNSNIAVESEAESWVVAGVVGAKSKERTTANKAKFCQFQLCDLKSSVITVFMFGNVKDRYHTRLRIGDVVAIMNPKVLKQAERTQGTIGVQIEHPDCLLIIGASSDFGQCKAVKMNGENCGRLLDTTVSAYCAQHIMMVADSRRNQRGSLIAGTSSIYDLDKLPIQAGPANLPRKIGGANQPNVQSNKFRMMAHGSRETTYLFDDGGIGTSSLIDHKTSKKGNERPDDILSSFLMSQNNPGGHYLRQAKASKEVAWAKDISSPKTPTKTELFPAEMIRRMGYDPVAGEFVPGSPKRTNDDLEARERSIRLLAERVKSPPAPMRSLKGLSPIRQRTIDVNGTARPIAQPRFRTGTAPSGSAAANPGGREVKGDVYFSDLPSRPKWVSLDDGDSSGSETDGEGNSLLSLSKQRAMNLLEAKTAGKGPALAAVAGGAAPRTLGSGMQMRAMHQTQAPAEAQEPGTGVLMATKRRSSLLQQAPLSTSSPFSVRDAAASVSKQPALPKVTAGLDQERSTTLKPESSVKQSAVSGVDTHLYSPGGSTTAARGNENTANKKPRFVNLSDSEENNGVNI